jgi:branched-subunit amino acid aminotransferase/4-amino-4-deoxychorismate lyase
MYVAVTWCRHLAQGVVVFAKQHLKRLYEGAKAIDMDIQVLPQQLLQMVYATLDANGMGQATGGWGSAALLWW